MKSIHWSGIYVKSPDQLSFWKPNLYVVDQRNLWWSKIGIYFVSYRHMPNKIDICHSRFYHFKASMVQYLYITSLSALGFCFQDTSLRVKPMETSPRTYLETNLSPFDSKTWKLECIKQTSTIFNALIFSTTSNTRFYYVESMYKLIIWQIIMGFLSYF